MANKHRHRTNKRIDTYIPCELCLILTYDENQCRPASQTHEVFYGSGLRNVSMDYGAQAKLCEPCHDAVHRRNRALDLKLKQIHQQRIMEEYNLDTDGFIKLFNRNYL